MRVLAGEARNTEVSAFRAIARHWEGFFDGEKDILKGQGLWVVSNLRIFWRFSMRRASWFLSFLSDCNTHSARRSTFFGEGYKVGRSSGWKQYMVLWKWEDMIGET